MDLGYVFAGHSVETNPTAALVYLSKHYGSLFDGEEDSVMSAALYSAALANLGSAAVNSACIDGLGLGVTSTMAKSDVYLVPTHMQPTGENPIQSAEVVQPNSQVQLQFGTIQADSANSVLVVHVGGPNSELNTSNQGPLVAELTKPPGVHTGGIKD